MFNFNNNPNGYGFNYGQPVQQFNGVAPQNMPKIQNVLTEEEMKKIMGTRDQFSLAITEDEHLRAICNHRGTEGDALETDPTDGSTVICKICGQKFTPIATDSPAEYVQNITDEFVNMLQTIKIMFVDFPSDAARTFFDIIPMAQKAPKLFAMAAKNLAKYENYGMFGYQNNSQSAMGLLNSFFGMVGAGQFGYPQGQPMYGQNPAYGNPNVMTGPTAQYNAFGYPGASQAQPAFGVYQPGVTGFAYQPPQTGQPQQQAPQGQQGQTTTTTNNQA